MPADWNDPNHPEIQQLAQANPQDVTPEAAAKAVQDMHDQLTPDQMKALLTQHYADMSPDQMKAIVAQMQQELATKDHPATQQAVAAIDPQTVTPQQAAELHAHAHEFHPDTVQKVVIAGAGAAVLGSLAVFAARKIADRNK